MWPFSKESRFSSSPTVAPSSCFPKLYSKCVIFLFLNKLLIFLDLSGGSNLTAIQHISSIF